MDFKIRKLVEDDYKTLTSWWEQWKWPVLPREFLPNNGTGGYMVCLLYTSDAADE